MVVSIQGERVDAEASVAIVETHLHPSSPNLFFVSMSITRPGVATTMWSPLERTSFCSCIEIPPIVSSTPSCGYPPSASAAHISWIPSYVWRASSRCGWDKEGAGEVSNVREDGEKDKRQEQSVRVAETYRRTDDHGYGSFSLYELHLSLLLEGEHDRRQRERERLSRTGERDPNHVTTRESARAEEAEDEVVSAQS